MKGTDPYSLIAGIILTLGGIALIVAAFFIPFLAIYGIIILIIGITILVTLKQQEYIEPIKTKQLKAKNAHL